MTEIRKSRSLVIKPDKNKVRDVEKRIEYLEAWLTENSLSTNYCKLVRELNSRYIQLDNMTRAYKPNPSGITEYAIR
jgi:hypothetical protein